MRIGAMNHPGLDVIEEVQRIAEAKFDFVDLTLEPPAARPGAFSVQDLQAVIRDTGLGVVGHTPYYLPIASPFENLQKDSVDEIRGCVEIFAELGCRYVNVHPDRLAPFHSRAMIIKRNLSALQEIVAGAAVFGIEIILENIPGGFNTASQLSELLDPLPNLGLHLDIGHCNLEPSGSDLRQILERFGSRLRHVHLHDNMGAGADLHLPLGVGKLKIGAALHLLQNSGYDGTITLEVFSRDRHFLEYSRLKLLEAWNAPESFDSVWQSGVFE